MGLTAARFVLPAVAVLAASLCASSLRTMAQEPVYPDRPLTMVVTFTAGGSSDVLARALRCQSFRQQPSQRSIARQ